MKKIVTLICFIFLPLMANAAIVQSQPIQVFVSVLPTKYFVERIGADKVIVHAMVQPGQSPETYSPTPRQMAQLQSSKLYFRVGVPFERAWLDKIISLNPGLKIVDLRQGIKLHKLVKSLDPHIWNDPILVMQMAKTIKDNLVAIDKKNQKIYRKNYSQLVKDLARLNATIIQTVQNLKHKKILVYHPAWGYFCNRYGLQQIAIEQQGKQPGPKRLNEIILQAKQNKIKVIFVAPQSSKTQTIMIAKTIDAKVVELNPLAENYLQNMLHVARSIATYLRQ